MPKSKGIYKVFKSKAEWEDQRLTWMAIEQQQTMDVITIVLNQEFGFGPERLLRLSEAFKSKWKEIWSMASADLKEDKDFVYSKSVIDRLLKQAVGEENFKPWEERYRI